MDTKLATKQIRLHEWAGIIKDCKASGMKVDDYCREHDLSRDAYYYWLRKVKNEALKQAGFIEMPSPLSIQPTAFRPEMTIRISNAELCIDSHTSAELIERVLGALDHVK